MIDNIDVYKNNNKSVHVEIEYPRNDKIDTVEIGLCDVRAADDIRIKYDFDRDGWVIYQQKSKYDKSTCCSIETGEWLESAFCPAWKYEVQ